MKNGFIKHFALILSITLLVGALFSCGSDPNIKQEEEGKDNYVVETTPEGEEKLLDGFHAYGSGKTDPIEIGGVKVDVCAFALRSYELAFMLAQKNFDKPTDIPLDAAVQFAFSHIYFKDLHSINNKAVQYKSATEKQISDSLKSLFGTDGFDIKKSMLYNSGKAVFEMWLPEYGTNVFYNIDSVNEKDAGADIRVTFYNEIKKDTLLGRETISVIIKDGKAYIGAMKEG